MATSKVEDVFDESVSDIGVGSKELEKLKTNLQKEGFRTGLSVGQERELQTGFNEAFSGSIALLKKVSIVRGQICAYLALNHINRGDQTTISEEVQNHLEDLLQKVQDFEHTCMEKSKELLTAEKIAQLETEVDKKVVEFQSQLHRILK
ncbi:protein YAE1 homolog [Crassostrea angulata]|uniref:protein YAE1 homolog n=1 Tax=Magallana angulata TaxID=2784310 RepID=UPI0022B1F030|nr:protein YAE1 homolog [Crassostrea angulata]